MLLHNISEYYLYKPTCTCMNISVNISISHRSEVDTVNRTIHLARLQSSFNKPKCDRSFFAFHKYAHKLEQSIRRNESLAENRLVLGSVEEHSVARIPVASNITLSNHRMIIDDNDNTLALKPLPKTT
jgi:hypothetical protein